jgi:hypothetical protein
MQVSIDLDRTLVQTLFKPGAPINGQTIASVLKTYDSLQYISLAELRGMFTEAEVLLIADVLNGYWYIPANPKHQLVSNVYDGITDNGLDKKWNVDKQALLNKLSSLSQFHSHVVLATVIQCWECTNYMDNTLDDLLRQSFQGEKLN